MYTELVYLKWNKEAQLSSRFRELLSDVFHLVRGDVVMRNSEIVNDHEFRENVAVENETEERYKDNEGDLNVGMKSLTVRAAVLTASPMQLRARHEYVPRDLSGDGMMKMLKMIMDMLELLEMMEMLIVMLANLLPLS